MCFKSVSLEKKNGLTQANNSVGSGLGNDFIRQLCQQTWEDISVRAGMGWWQTAGVTWKWQPLNRTPDCFVTKHERVTIPKVPCGNKNLMFVGKLPGVWDAVAHLKFRIKSVASPCSIDLPSGICCPLGFLLQFSLQLVKSQKKSLVSPYKLLSPDVC